MGRAAWKLEGNEVNEDTEQRDVAGKRHCATSDDRRVRDIEKAERDATDRKEKLRVRKASPYKVEDHLSKMGRESVHQKHLSRQAV